MNIKGRAMASVPIMIGVTGHRDIYEEDYQELKRRVQSIFADLKAKYPFTPIS